MVLEKYNKKQTRQERKIEDYFEHVAGKEQDMAVEIIIQIGDMEFWKLFDDMKSYMKLSYQIILDKLRKRLPQFVVANAVVHLDEDIKLFASKIAYKELERSQTKELNEKRSELQSVRQEIASVTDKANEAVELLGKINAFISSFRLFAPTIEEYANHVEADKIIEAGNSFRGIFYEIGKLLETFKELIKEGLCWFPRLMRWKTSKGEVAPVFIEKSNGYSYSVYGYMNVDTKEYYSKESIQWEIKAGNRTGTVEQMDANVEAMARDLQEILRIGTEQKRLWEVYEGR